MCSHCGSAFPDTTAVLLGPGAVCMEGRLGGLTVEDELEKEVMGAWFVQLGKQGTRGQCRCHGCVVVLLGP